jgi:hypothetical protein
VKTGNLRRRGEHVELTLYFRDIRAFARLDTPRQHTRVGTHSSLKAPSRCNLGGHRRRPIVSSRLDDLFCEGLARDLLERDGPEIFSRLRLEAIAARGEGHRRGAELLIEIADVAERLLRQTGQSN